LEQGSETGYNHWQFVFATSKKKSLAQIREIFGGQGHFELTRSRAADDYVWKDDTSLGERFELGRRPTKRNSIIDWDAIRDDAVRGELDNIPADIYIRYYNSLTKIGSDHAKPHAIVRRTHVFWGKTGTGKSRRAWEEAGDEAYSKDPRTKWWTGYRGNECVVIDEFRGGIDIAHILRWTDRYAVSVETKGGSRPLCAERIWITSNLHPGDWYPELDRDTTQALMRRLIIEEIK
jgi:hypothetical protein